MNFWIALLIFVANIADDILCVLYIRRSASGDAISAAILSGILTAIVAFSVVSYVKNKKYLIPAILGSMIGTYLAILWDKGG